MNPLASLRELAAMLRVPTERVQQALRSAPAARAALSRRDLFAAAAALAVGPTLVSVPVALEAFDTNWIRVNGILFSADPGFPPRGRIRDVHYSSLIIGGQQRQLATW